MTFVVLILALFCALQAIRATHLLDAVLWLAAVSALIATMFYVIGAWQIAAIELSVGTGLVTVLMVFAITMVGNERETITGRRLLLGLIIGSVLTLTLLTVPFLPLSQADSQQPFGAVLWQERGLDLLLQVVLIFSGVLGVIDLLAAAHQTPSSSKESNGISDAVLPESNLKPVEKEAA